MDFTQALGSGIQAPPPQPSTFAGMQSPEPSQMLNSIQKPAASPEEFQKRQSLWAEVVQRVNTDPNLRQAMLMMGVHLAQPTPPGQTTFGHAMQALGTGASAYNAGEYTQWAQKQQEAEAARKQAESQATVAHTQAATKNVQAATALAEGTQQLKIDQLKTQNEAALVALEKAKDDNAISKIENELKKRRADIMSSIPDETLRKSMLADLEQSQLKVDEARQRIQTAKSTEEFTRARTDLEKKQIDALQGMNPEQLREYFTKSGPYSSSALSGVVQQGNFWGKIYDKLPATDAEKAGRTREQYMAFKMKQSTDKNQLELLVKAYQNVSDPELQTEIEGMIGTMVRQMADKNKARAAEAAKGASGAGAQGDGAWTDMGNGYQKRIKANGVVEVQKKPGGEQAVGGPSP